MIKVRFSASGYGTTTETYSTREQAKAAIENEAEDVLADHNSDPERASLAGGHRVFASRHSFRLEDVLQNRARSPAKPPQKRVVP